MYEYRIRAIFGGPYLDRTYKRKIVTSEEEANELLKVAKEYYENTSYSCYLIEVKIEKRKVSKWK